MVQTFTKKKIHIIIDAAAVPKVVTVAMKAGAKGHTIVPHVSGRGPRGIRGAHDVFDDAETSIVIIVSSEDVIMRILDQVMELLETHAGIAYVSDVQVARPDHF